jgi:hypothetical protein
MQKVNAKIFALKYKLLKVLTNSIEKDKNAIKEGAEITYKDYAKIKLVDCVRTSYSKEDQKKLDEYASKMLISKQVTHYTRIDIDNIPTEVDDKVNEILDTLENNNDKVIAKAASKVARVM